MKGSASWSLVYIYLYVYVRMVSCLVRWMIVGRRLNGFEFATHTHTHTHTHAQRTSEKERGEVN